jgi:hypothetical protein
MALREKQISVYLIENLKKVFEKHHLAGSFITEPMIFANRPYDCIFKTQSGITLYIVITSAVSVKTAERYDALSKKLDIENQRILLVSFQIPQMLIEQFDGSRLNFYSPEGSSKIEFPSFCYIVSILGKKKGVARNSGTVFVGKASSLPRLFLAEPRRKWTQGELSDAAGVTRGYVSMVLKKMLQEEYIALSNGKYELTAPDKMLNDWSAVYRFARYIKRQMFAMHFTNYDDGLRKLNGILTDRKIKFAYMGPAGAYLREPYMKQDMLTAYVQEMPEECMDLFPVENGGNVVLYIPQSERIFIGEQKVNDYPVVSDVQLYLDLKKMPGRNEDQAEYLRQNKMFWE